MIRVLLKAQGVGKQYTRTTNLIKCFQSRKKHVSSACAKFVNSKSDFQRILDENDTFMFDCDGVLYHGDAAVEGAASVLNHLNNIGKNVVYATNSSSKTRDIFLDKLQLLGFPAKMENVFSTAYTSALFLKSVYRPGGKVYIIGNPSMAKELENVGIESLGVGPDMQFTKLDLPMIEQFEFDDSVYAVLCGFDGHISFSKIMKAASYLSNDKCMFVATNEDHRYPTKNPKLVVPSAGIFINALAHAASRQVDVLAGKPGKFMFECIRNSVELNPSRTLMVGDRINTDILFGNRNSCQTLLVLSGIETRKSLTEAESSGQSECVPNYYLGSLTDWSAYL